MLLSFHYTDLEEGLPRVLPFPLSSAALYIRPDQLPEEVKSLLTEAGVDDIDERGRWFIRVWDERVPNDPVAEAVFSRRDGKMDAEAVAISAPYGPMNLEGYLQDLGRRLWAIKD